jgi:arsenate reductase (thioredoxin)
VKRVLFVCTGNRARSQMAEALLRFHGGDRFEAFSAGTEPKGVAPETIEVMRELNVDVSGRRSKHVDEFAGQEFDYVITVCDSARQVCPTFPGPGERLHWSIEDPDVPVKAGIDRLDAFRAARDDIRGRIIDFLADQGCIFCSILAGEAAASFVYRDDAVAAFLDVRPMNAGHLLVIPLAHVGDVRDVPEEVAGRLMNVAQRAARALERAAVRMDGFNLYLSNGRAIGQEVFHVHLHVVPRFAGDGFGLRFGPEYGKRPPREELEALAEKITSAWGRQQSN